MQEKKQSSSPQKGNQPRRGRSRNPAHPQRSDQSNPQHHEAPVRRQQQGDQHEGSDEGDKSFDADSRRQLSWEKPQRAEDQDEKF